MGYKNFWQGGLGLLLLCILHHDILADGDVGEYIIYDYFINANDERSND